MKTVAMLAAVLAVVLVPAGATGAPTQGEIDISGAELAGSSGVADIDVFGTVRCAAAGPLSLDVTAVQPFTVVPATGSNNGLTCPEPGALVKWVVTASGQGFVVGEKIQIDAAAAGSTVAVDSEEHVLRWGR
jgi:hypothetical protein